MHFTCLACFLAPGAVQCRGLADDAPSTLCWFPCTSHVLFAFMLQVLYGAEVLLATDLKTQAKQHWEPPPASSTLANVMRKHLTGWLYIM